jgi:hypothetical protein
MSKFRHTLNVFAVVIFTLTVTSLAQAQATRTWVSGVGDDANPCSRTAPCKTFAGAISKTFTGGEIDAIDPGGFGVINITKSITIDGGGTFASILASGTNGVTVNVGVNANDPQRRVTLRRLSINGTGASGTVGTSTGIRGINAIAFTSLHVENCYINNFTTVGIDVNVGATTSFPLVSITDTNISNTGTGIQMTTATGGVLTGVMDKTRVENCANGILAKDRAFVTIRDSVVQGPGTGTGVGIQAPSNSAGINLESTVIFNWATGVAAGAGGSRVDLSNTSILNNTTGITVGGSAANINSHGNNVIAGNSSAGTTPNPVGPQ